MNTKWVGIVLSGVMVSTLSFAARTVNPSYLNGNVVGLEEYPQWNLGTPGSTWQDWTDVSEGFLEPDEANNIYAKENGLMAYVNDLNDWGFSGLGVNISVPNIPSSRKTIWFEVVYEGEILPDIEASSEGVSVSPGMVQSTPTVTRFYADIPEPEATGLKVMTLGWTITPSPFDEWFTFYLLGDNSAIQSISIDTLSAVVPAPGAVVLAGFGVGILGYFRRKY